jgi:PilZ domain-containing protein
MENAFPPMAAHFDDAARGAERRGCGRRELRLGTRAGKDPVTILNLSARGMLIESAAVMLIGTKFAVELPYAGLVAAEVVWNRGEFYGCEFDHQISYASVSAALLQSPPDQVP